MSTAPPVVSSFDYRSVFCENFACTPVHMTPWHAASHTSFLNPCTLRPSALAELGAQEARIFARDAASLKARALPA